MSTSTTSAVSSLYEAIDYTAPDHTDLNSWVALLNSGQLTEPALISQIENSQFTLNVVDPVVREYQAAFGRLPDQAGISYWVGVVATNPTALANLNVIFTNSSEFAGRYLGADANTVGGVSLVTALYTNVLGRAPDQAGLNYWVSQNLTAAQLLQVFSQSPEYVGDTAAVVVTYQNMEAAGAPPPSSESLFSLPYTLPTQAVTVNGYADVIADLTPLSVNGVGPTLVAGDVLSDIAILTINDEYAQGADTIPTGAQLSDIADIVLDAAGNAGVSTSSPFNTASVSGVQTLTVTSSGAGADYVEAAQTTDVTINHQNMQGGIVSLGGDDVTVVSAGGSVQVGNGGAATDPVGTVLITTGSAESSTIFGADVTVEGGDSVTVNTVGGNVQVGAVGAPVRGPVVINDTYGGTTQDDITVMGGTTVDINLPDSFNNTITVGNAAGGFAAAADDPTGSVAITDQALSAGEEIVGLESFSVVTNGATSVSITGAYPATGSGAALIEDVQSTLSGAGDANGTSLLATVSLVGVYGDVTIQSDALTSLTIDDDPHIPMILAHVSEVETPPLTVTIKDDSSSQSLILTLNAVDQVTVVDSQGQAGFTQYKVAGITNLTVNTVANSDVTLDMPGVTSATFNDTGNLTATLNDNNVVTITQTGPGQLNLGNLTADAALTSVSAVGATAGADVEINPQVTSFKGGGADVVLLSANAFGASVDVSGGAGSIVYVLSPPSTPLADIPSTHFSGFSGFGILAASASAYDVTGFSEIIVGGILYLPVSSSGPSGNVTIDNASDTASLDITQISGGAVNYSLQSSYSGSGGNLFLTVSNPGQTTSLVLGSDNITSLSIYSQAGGTPAVLNVSESASVTSVTINGGSVTLDDSNATAGLIDAAGSFGAVDMTGMGLAPTGVTVDGGSGPMIARGSTASGSAVDMFNLGVGGGEVVLGAGGAGFDAGRGTNSGAELVNLQATGFALGTDVLASANVTAGDGSFGIFNPWDFGSVANYSSAQIQSGFYAESADTISFAQAPEVIANGTNIAPPSNDGVFYDAVGGFFTVGGSATPSASEELIDVQAIIDRAPLGTIGAVRVEWTFGKLTEPVVFVIENEGGGAQDPFLALLGRVVTGFGEIVDNLAGGTSVSLQGGNIANLFANLTANNGGAVSGGSYNDAGETIDTLSGAISSGATNSYLNLNNYAILETATTSGQNVVVTQTGADPSLVINATGPSALASLTYGNSTISHDNPLITLDSSGGSLSIGDLIDATGAGQIVAISGSNPVTVAGITDPALQVVNASTLGASLSLTAAQNGLTIVGSPDGDVINADGNSDTITVSSASGVATINALGAGDTLQLGGNGVSAWLGAEATVNLQGTGNPTLVLSSSAAGASLADMTVINGVATAGGLTLQFDSAGPGGAPTGVTTEAFAAGNLKDSQVNVAGATSLANALGIAANEALNVNQKLDLGANTTKIGQPAAVELNAHTGLVDWFQYAGNTYIVEVVNATNAAAAHLGLASGDIVVELSGLVYVPQSNVGFLLA
jgi:hypothetical protein